MNPPSNARTTVNPARGDVWYVDLDPTEGSEQGKIRPCVVVSVDGLRSFPVRMVVPLSSWKEKYEHYPYVVRCSAYGGHPKGDNTDSAALAFQARTVSTNIGRFKQRLGVMPIRVLEEIIQAVALCIGYDN